MHRPVAGLRTLVGTPTGRKLVRYFLASAVNVIVAEAILAFAFGFLHWTARSAAVLAGSVAAFPAYWLARRWVWGRSGRSHLVKEVLPFWTLALLGVALNTWVAGLAEAAGADVTASRLGQTLIVTGSVLVASGAFWVVRFLLLNGILFADRSSGVSEPLEPMQGAEVSRSVP
jgi:putative flippase GtrA